MKTQGNDRLREMLAAAYVVGTMRGAARRRFAGWLRDDTGLRAKVDAWNARLAPLLDALPSRTPPRRVWQTIEASLPGFTALRGDRFASETAWWDKVAFWRPLAGAFAVVAGVAIGVALRPAPLPVTEVSVVEVVPAAVASIGDPKSGRIVATIFGTRGGQVVVRVADDVAVPEGRALQLWTTDNGKDLVSVGMVPASARGAPATMRPADAGLVARSKAFGLSLEPTGGSPQPTHVLGLGPTTRVGP